MRLKLVIVSTVFLMFLAIPDAGAVGIDFNLALGAQFEGSISDVDFDTDEGFSLGLELMFDLPLIDVGVGYEYGFPRDGQHIEDLEYNYVYGIGRLTLLGPVYMVGRYGWADVSVSDLDSDYSKQSDSWSVGAGVKISSFRIEAMYNSFDINLGGGSSEDYSNYAARLVYTF